MSANGVSGTDDDVDMAECDQEKVVTMMDVLKEQQEFEEDADAVLGASDDKDCTYSKGYIKRQAIYACLTCCEDAKTDPSKRAGVCLACSLSCHENHDLVELYTKRNFRCDCGNPKFNSHPCQFVPEKPDLNEDNHYDQNFSGLYCTCHRPYPDPEFPVEDEMIQCIICEDWLHSCHLEAMVPVNEQYAEMICKGCMDKNEFLHDYSDIAVTAEPDDVDVINATNTDVTMTKDTNVFNGNLEKEPLNGSEKSSNIDEKKTINDESAENEKMESDLCNDTKINGENITSEVTGSAEKVSEENDIKNKESDSSIESKEEQNKAAGEVTTNETEQNKDVTSLPKDIVTEAAGDGTTNEKAEEPVTSTLEPEDKTKDEATNDTERINKTEINIEDKEKCEADKDLTEDSSDKIEQSNENQLPVNEPQQPSEENPEADKDITDKDQSTENLKESQTIEKSNESSMNVDQEVIESDVDKNKESSEDQEENKINVNKNEESLEDLEENKTDVNTNKKSSEDLEENKTDIDQNKEISEDLEENNSDIDKKESSDPTKDNDNTDKLSENKIETKNTEESNKTNEVADKENSSEKDKYEITEDKTFDSDIVMDTVKEEKKVESPNINENVGISDLKGISENEVSENTLKESELTTQTPVIKEGKRKLSTEELLDEVTTKKPKLDDEACLRPKGVKRRFKGATFWPSQFRQKLCTCNECISMYKDLSVLFLIDPEDTVSAYETLGKEKIDGTPASQYEKGLQALSSLDRIQQINALTEYNRMRDKLLDFLKSFKDRKEVVKEEDIKAFFARMKPKREPDGVYFCR